MCGARALPTVRKDRHFLVPADERCVARSARFQSRDIARTYHLVDRHRSGEPLEALLAEVAILEAFHRKLPGDGGNHHRIGPREGLKARREICRLADYRTLVGDALGVGIAHDHQSSGDFNTHMDVEGRELPSFHRATSSIRSSPARNRALRIVLVCHRITEISENPVAEVARDIAVIAFDRLGAGRLVGDD